MHLQPLLFSKEYGMAYYVYILFSDKLSKYYAGQTHNVIMRLNQHNKGECHFTSTGIPWVLIHFFEWRQSK